ncbi:carbohydrate ABC transporter permease [Paenibacillus puerhi]|uniref:carbohydrate ABC transporter permease n=1 Tax=Paenibacillus puerhi TaxID=2692622 RepID=UPI001359C799|nr:carbohydrate ABC transporter permease [Paenibacillus puerhi]
MQHSKTMKPRKRKIEMFDIVNYSVLSLFSLAIIIPFIFIINQSVMRNEDILTYGYTLIPKSISFSAYHYLLVENSAMLRAFLVSVGVTGFGTFLNVLVTSMFAYGLSKKNLPYRNFFTILLFITMLFNGGLIPKYLLISSIGLKDTYLALILPGLMSAWNTLILRNFFSAIPDSLIESAHLDGANEYKIFSSIILPLSKAALATIGLFYAVAHWNNWFNAAIFITDKNKWPMQLLLKEMLDAIHVAASSGAVDSIANTLPTESVKAAAIIITTFPIVMVYPFVQKYFVKGVMIGSVKG